MIVQRLSHIGLCVSDLERSATFYREVFGFNEISRISISGEETETLLEIPDVDLEAIYMERDGTRLELLYYKVPGAVKASSDALNILGLTHLSFRVSDLDQVVEKVEMYGGESIAHTGMSNPQFQAKTIIVRDPDGQKIELLQVPGDPNWLPGMPQ